MDETTTTRADDADVPAAPTFRRRLRRWFFHRAIRALTLAHIIALGAAGMVPMRRRRRCRGRLRILITGRFDSANWVRAHLKPLAESANCEVVWMVSTRPVPEMPKVVGLYPPRWLVRILGASGARLLTFAFCAMRRRPDVVGGFHLLINGMAAAVVGRFVAARSMYFCVGGPAEVLDGGVRGEGNYFAMMETPDPLVERRLLKTVEAFDLVITMGTRAAAFFRDRGVTTDIRVVPGGIDSSRFADAGGAPSVDVILTARLTPIKRIDVLLESLARARGRLGGLTAAIVGDGPIRADLERMASELGLDGCVRFAGHQDNVEAWLTQSRLFLLTSDSEGLSLALMEAMVAGLPAVVSDVGDLADLVTDGVNGFLAPRRDPEAFADRIVELLGDEPKRAAFAAAARRDSRRYETSQTVQHWDRILRRYVSQ